MLRVVLAAGLLAGVTPTIAACGGSAAPSPAASRPPSASTEPNRVRLLAFGVLPNRQGFWITVRRFPAGGRSRLNLTADLQPPGRSKLALHEAFGSAGRGTLTPSFSRGPLSVGTVAACARRPVTLVLGLLRPGSGTAVLRYGGHRHAMRRIAIPGYLRAGGDLVYGYASRPLTVELRSAFGRIVESAAIPAPALICGGPA